MMPFDDARVIANTGKRGSSQRVMKPLWKFAQHGQCGRWASDLFPEIEPARRRPVLHPLAAHRGRRPRPGDAVSALRLDEFRPAVDGLVGAVRPRHRERRTCPVSSRIAPVGRQRRAAQLRQRLPAGGLPGHAARPGRRPAPPRRRSATSTDPLSRRGPAQRSFDLLRELNAEQLKQSARRLRNWKRSSNSYELAWRMQTNAPDVLDLSQGIGRDAASSTASARRRPTTSAGSA